MTIEDIIIGLQCFKTLQPKCAECPFNPQPGREWIYGCRAGQSKLVDAAIAALKEYNNGSNT